MACSPNFLIQEFNTNALHSQILREPFVLENGFLTPPIWTRPWASSWIRTSCSGIGHERLNWKNLSGLSNCKRVEQKLTTEYTEETQRTPSRAIE